MKAGWFALACRWSRKWTPVIPDFMRTHSLDASR
jgi:hypothetical protein